MFHLIEMLGLFSLESSESRQEIFCARDPPHTLKLGGHSELQGHNHMKEGPRGLG